MFLTNTDTQAPNYMAYISENHNPAHLENMEMWVNPHTSQLHTYTNTFTNFSHIASRWWAK
jgi:hypothetical protein